MVKLPKKIFNINQKLYDMMAKGQQGTSSYKKLRKKQEKMFEGY